MDKYTFFILFVFKYNIYILSKKKSYILTLRFFNLNPAPVWH